jgi:DNA-binding transcriptional ArsR family regulator
MDTGLIFHPVRLQIITAVSGRRITTRELLRAIPDVPQATLYRHVRALIRGGVLEVAGERRIRGVEERIIRMKAPPAITPRDLKGKSVADLEQIGVVFVSGLLADIRRYLRGKKKVDPFRDGVQVSKVMLQLSDAELSDLNGRIVGLLMAAADNEPGSGRRSRVFSYLIIPAQ